MVQAIVLYEFKSTEGNELTVYKSEIVDVVQKDDDWWKVKNKNGESGLVPVNYLAAPVTDDVKVLSRGKTKESHQARSDNETSIEKDCQVAVLDDTDDYWWFVGYAGQTGFIPKHIIHLFKSKSNAKEKEKDAIRFSFKEIAPARALCDEETTVLFSFQKQLPAEGNYVVIFKGEHCEKVVDGVRLNDFTIKAITPKYYPAERTHIRIDHHQASKPPQIVVKGVRFTFDSKLDIVHKILSAETEPLKFLCSSFQIEHGDIDNVDRILSGNLEKKVPDGVDLIKSSRSALVQEQVFKKETPTLLHFAAYYNLKKLAKSLLRCPGAKEAMSVKNCHGNGPVGVAQLRNHVEMEQLLQDHKTSGNAEESFEQEYMSMEECYEQYIKMGSPPPEYIVPDTRQRSQSAPQDEDEIYEDMEGGNADDQEHYDTPRPEGDDRFGHYDDDFDDNANKINDNLAIQKQIEEYKVFGRMTEKEVQLALLMKRVKERYITQEQALEMARVLHLEPQQSTKSLDSKKKPKAKKRISAPSMPNLERKTQSLPRTMSTSSGSSVSSVGSTGSTASSGYTSDSVGRPPAPAKVPSGGRPFSYLGSKPPVVSPKKSVSPPPTTPRKPATRTPSDPAPPVPVRRTPRQ